MIKAKFLTPARRSGLEQIVRRPSEDHGVARRVNAILLLDDGKSCAVTAEFLYLDGDTVRNWHNQYLSGGLDPLTTFDWKGGLTFLNTAQKAALCGWLEAHFICDMRPIIAFIKAEFSVQYSHSGCLKLLHRLGFEYRKPKALPRVANEAAQQQFIGIPNLLQNPKILVSPCVRDVVRGTKCGL